MNACRNKLTWIFASLLVATSFEVKIVNCQIEECTLQGIDLKQCFDQGSKSSEATSLCCKSLNKAIQEGYYCICKLIGSKSPLLRNSLILPMPNCFISIPPLNQCQEPVVEPPESVVPEINPPPVSPPELPQWQMQPSPSLPQDLLVPPPIPQNNASSDDEVANQPAVNPELDLGDTENGVLVSSVGNKNVFWLNLLPPAALYVVLCSEQVMILLFQGWLGVLSTPTQTKIKSVIN